MLKITGEIVDIAKNTGQIGDPLGIYINDRASELFEASGFDAKNVQCVLLLTEEEMARITYALITEPEEGFDVPESAKQLSVVHNYLQRRLNPQGIFNQDIDQLALELTKVWAEMNKEKRGDSVEN